MGAFVVNFHIKTTNVDQLRSACEKLKLKNYRIASPQKIWSTLFEERSATQDDAIIKKLASGLSTQLKLPCIAFLIHDSDIACYWIYDNGKLLDEFNSCPDYFDDNVSDREREQLQGRPDVFLQFCKPGVTLEQVEEVLQSEPTFADDIIAHLAELLGIKEEVALSTYGDEDGERDGFGDDFDDEDDDDEPDSSPRSLKFPGADIAGMQERMQQQFAQMMGGTASLQTSAASDALVNAATEGDVTKVEHLLQQGVPVNEPGKMSMQGMPGINSGMMMNPMFQPTAAPLLAAASRGRAEVAKLLIDHGAKLDDIHPMFGSALHAAAQAGSPETVSLLLNAGVPAHLQTAQGHSALKTLRMIRQKIDAARSMFKNIPGMQQEMEKMMGQRLPEAGWEACEKLLEEAGG